MSPNKTHIIRNDVSGFTLIEVIMVMVLIAIMAGITSALLTDFLPNMRLRGAARDLHSNIQHIRLLAIKNNRPAAIFFNNNGDANASNDTYTLYDDSGDGDWTTLGDNNIISTVSLSSYNSNVKYGHLGLGGNISPTTPAGVIPTDNVSYTANRLVFNERGTCSGGYVYLDNDNSAMFAVGTRPSGFVTLLRWDKNGNWK